MSDAKIEAAVLALADADADLSEAASLWILAALGSDADWAAVADDPSSHRPRPLDVVREGVAVEPVGAFVKSIQVEGFRGIGPSARIDLSPTPGLVVVAGRNGSGKSTFAEALELAMTGDSYRWADRSAVWKGEWRNLHHGLPAAIRVQIAEEGRGLTTLGVDWDEHSALEDRRAWVQRDGAKREDGLNSLGWAQALALFRPLLSYDELGGLLEDAPSKLFDALFAILGLQRVVDAQRRLDDAVRSLAEPKAQAAILGRELKTSLAASADERARSAEVALKHRPADIDAVRAIAVGVGAGNDSRLAQLRILEALAFPTGDEVQRRLDELEAAAQASLEMANDDAGRAEAGLDLLRGALAWHAHGGDAPCPVCGAIVLDAAWHDATVQLVADAEVQFGEARRLRERLAAAHSSARALITPIPEALVSADGLGLSAAADVRESWLAWAAAPESGIALAAHIRARHLDCAAAVELLRQEASAAAAAREDAWAPVALRLASWVDVATQARDREDRLAYLTEAKDWLRSNADQLRNERLEPLGEQARHIWAILRQESNVDLGAVRLEGVGNRRRVDLVAEVDGSRAGALGVMSQGELHALALALFLPRATMPASPFRFLVLDDPVQAMDPAKVDGLVNVLMELAATRQVVVFTHDDRLPAAVRRMALDARILEVSRATGSRVEITTALDPGRRYLEDARALNRDDDVPDDIKRRTIPGLCRLAVESVSRDRFYARRFGSGQDLSLVEAAWGEATTTRMRMALAVHDDARARLDRWVEARPHRLRGVAVCASAAHEGLQGPILNAIESVEAMVEDLRGDPA